MRRAPAGLDKAGRSLWRVVLTDVESRGNESERFELDARELVLLEHACRIADEIAQLEDVVARRGRTARGSKGQTIMHPAIAEIRLQRESLRKTLSTIGFDTGAEEKRSMASSHARRAAESRWTQRDAQLRVIDGGA